MNFLFNKTLDLLSGMLDYRTKRHQVIASNVANMDTAGFKPSDLSFQSELDRTRRIQMTTTDPAHLGDRQHGAVDFEMETSGEMVKLDQEMANLAENHLMYNMTVDMLARKFRGIQTVLKETR